MIKQGYLYCIHCERTYKDGEFRLVTKEVVNKSGKRVKISYKMCPYEGCDGDAVLDCWEWEHIRDGHPEYPDAAGAGRSPLEPQAALANLQLPQAHGDPLPRGH